MFGCLRQLRVQKILSVVLLLLLFTGRTSAHALSSCGWVFTTNVVETLIRQEERPTAKLIDRIGPERILKSVGAGQEIEPKFYKVLEAAALQLMNDVTSREIFFVARDGEWFYDAMTAVVDRYPNAERIRERIHLLNVSRPIANNTSGETLFPYLKANGLDVEKILDGRMKVVLIDTGERGSIFVNILQKAVETYDFSGPNWRRRLTNLLEGFEVRLLHSSEASNKSEILQRWKSMQRFDSYQVSSDLYDLGFKELIKSQRKQIGIPTNHYDLHDWIVSEFERRKHWFGRGTSVDANGRVTNYENIDNDRNQALSSQARIVKHFTENSVVQKFRTAIESAIEKCKNGCR